MTLGIGEHGQYKLSLLVSSECYCHLRRAERMGSTPHRGSTASEAVCLVERIRRFVRFASSFPSTRDAIHHFIFRLFPINLDLDFWLSSSAERFFLFASYPKIFLLCRKSRFDRSPFGMQVSPSTICGRARVNE